LTTLTGFKLKGEGNAGGPWALGSDGASLMSSRFNPSDLTIDGPLKNRTVLLGNREERSVLDLVEAQAVLRPDSLAVAYGAAALTYRELNDRADQLASLLVSAGVGRESVVGLCLPRSLGMIVGALGIFKSGAAYLPLDPANPSERLAFMLRDSQVSVLVTEASLACSFSSMPSAIVFLSNEGRLLSHESSRSQNQPPSAQDLAYVIYTSGTSGRPKGVEVTHANLLNLVQWHCDAFAVTSADRASHVAGIGFDASVWEIWPYLAKGASVHIADKCIVQNPESLRDWMISEKVTIGFAPTALAERMISLDWPSDAGLRILLTGASVLQRHPSQALPFRFVNNYGLTECTVVSTSVEVCVNGHGDLLPPIGRPIASTDVYILDDQLSPVEQGVAGEIYIGGKGVARGYRNAPDLTEARFVPDPFKNDPRTRLYRTGDLGKFLPDGQIAFLGRIDQQVKIRGFRVEPEEIASVLNRHPSVEQSAVIGRRYGRENETRLLAYIVPKKDSTPSAGDLRNHLSSFLPEYMIPSAFVCMESLPLNTNGKIDVAALPLPQRNNTLHEKASAGPVTPLEQRVAGILAGLLNLDQVNSDDNFFFLGGHSLLGTQLINRLRDVFGVDLSLKSLFDHPTVAQLSQEIEQLLVAKLNAMTEEEAEERLKSLTEQREEA
jgi:amino acid adenylation domain-containing protein